MTQLTIVMYHYVRPIAGSRFPGIKGLERAGFERQLDYLQDRFTVVDVEQIQHAAAGRSVLPDNACWLTFDDGYLDHHQYVFPALKQHGMQGAFFPPSCAIDEGALLDVNLVHHILASAPDIRVLRQKLDEMCLNSGLTAASLDQYWAQYGVANRFDDAETIYVKRLLQHVLPERLRHSLAEELFLTYVGQAPKEFSSSLYMSKDQLRELVDGGMCVGSHGARHYWLNQIDEEAQREDIGRSLSFLEEVGVSRENWVMCYPYGGYNQQTLQVVKELGASLGVTTEVRKADLALDNPLALPRFDTNDFPQ